MFTQLRKWFRREEWNWCFDQGYEWTMAMIGTQRLPDISGHLKEWDRGTYRAPWNRQRNNVRVPTAVLAYEAGVRDALLEIARDTPTETAQERIINSNFFNRNHRPERRLI